MKPRRRLGLLVPSTDIVMEYDIWSHLPPETTLHVARMLLEHTTVAGIEKMLDEESEPAARQVGTLEPHLLILGCTSGAALRGLAGEKLLSDKLAAAAGCPCITVFHAGLTDLRAVNPKRLFLATPYVPKVTERMMKTLAEANIPVVGQASLGLDRDRLIGAVTPDEIADFVTRSVKEAPAPPDCVFISCTTFRAFEAAEGLQASLGIPVLTANLCTSHAIHQFFKDNPA